MTANEIKVGGKYVAKVSNKLVIVRVESINDDCTSSRHLGYNVYGQSKGYGKATRYTVTNLTTGRTTVFRSAAKFRKEVKSDASN